MRQAIVWIDFLRIITAFDCFKSNDLIHAHAQLRISFEHQKQINHNRANAETIFPKIQLRRVSERGCVDVETTRIAPAANICKEFYDSIHHHVKSDYLFLWLLSNRNI